MRHSQQALRIVTDKLILAICLSPSWGFSCGMCSCHLDNLFLGLLFNEKTPFQYMLSQRIVLTLSQGQLPTEQASAYRSEGSVRFDDKLYLE